MHPHEQIIAEYTEKLDNLLVDFLDIYFGLGTFSCNEKRVMMIEGKREDITARITFEIFVPSAEC
ncbi:MAG: hypothetical protein AB4206_03220 [Xenococcaceae cyanobacterium]